MCSKYNKTRMSSGKGYTALWCVPLRMCYACVAWLACLSLCWVWVAPLSITRLEYNLANAIQHFGVWRYTCVMHVLRDSRAHLCDGCGCLLQINQDSYVLWRRLPRTFMCVVTYVSHDPRGHLCDGSVYLFERHPDLYVIWQRL